VAVDETDVAGFAVGVVAEVDVLVAVVGEGFVCAFVVWGLPASEVEGGVGGAVGPQQTGDQQFHF
jgi:hypothetical protein